MQFGSNPDLIAEVVMVARRAARQRPLWVKLMPLATDIGLTAKAAVSSGADALTVANTYPAMAIDVRTGKSKLGNPTGVLSGPAIKPITLGLVWEARKARKAVNIPIVGLGGVETAEKVLDYTGVGVSAVQGGTASIADPRASEGTSKSLGALVRTIKCNAISELKDRFGADFG